MSKLWFGCIEGRMDPLFLGRVKVRVVGLHTNNKVLLPTEDLPWATVIQPITSAAMSGIGQSPVGPVEGTWVAVQFLDDECQYPIVIGTVAGIPGLQDSVASAEEFTVPEDNEDIPENVVRTGSGGILVDGSGNPVTTTPTGDEKFLGSLNKSQFDQFRDAVKNKESGNRYNIMGGAGGAYAGAYQMGIAALEDMGYIKKGTYSSKGGKASVFDDQSVWTGKDGITSKESYLNNPSVQDSVFESYTRYNLKRLKSLDPSTIVPEKLAGLLGVAHNQGAGAVTKLLDGDITADGFGTTTLSYYNNVGYKAIAGKTTKEVPTRQNLRDESVDKKKIIDPSKNQYDVQDSPVVKKRQTQPETGFSDPNKKYPLSDHLGEPDTNRLARNQRINRTIMGDREMSLIHSIPVANSSTTWNEPNVPYNAMYPFNHVWQTESGHVMEFDDTPGNERINLHHRSGTFKETDSSGNTTEKIKGSNVVIVEHDELVYVKGSGHVCVDGDLSIIVKGQCNIKVIGNTNVVVDGDMTTKVNGNKYEYVKGNLVTVVDGSKYENVLGSLDVTTGSNHTTKSGGNYEVLADSQLAFDGFQIHMNSGRASTATTKSVPDISYTPTIVQPMPISRKEIQSMKLEDTPEAKIPDPTTPPIVQKEADKVVPTSKPVTPPGDCASIPKPYGPNTQLSTNFTIGKLQIGSSTNFMPPLKGQCNLTQDQIVCNMMQLTLNVIEPIYTQFASKGMTINSCLRPFTVGKSQHEKGQAVDLGFKVKGSKLSKKEYYDIAVWIKNNLTFDQLLLEYRGADHWWIHVSYNTTGNRNQVLTLVNDKTHSQGLVLIG